MEWFSGIPKMQDDVEFYFWKSTDDVTWPVLKVEKIIAIKMRKVFPNIKGGNVCDFCSGVFGYSVQLEDNSSESNELLKGLWYGPLKY